VPKLRDPDLQIREEVVGRCYRGVVIITRWRLFLLQRGRRRRKEREGRIGKKREMSQEKKKKEGRIGGLQPKVLESTTTG